MNIDTILLQAFIATVDTGSITQASKKMCRTQSAVSQQIAKLESFLGKQLFIRGKKFILTEEGEIFFSYAKQILKLHYEVIDRFKDPELEGEVTFGLPEDFANKYLAEILNDFSRNHPRVLFRIECDLTMNLFKRFKNKEFDLVLVKMNHPEDFPHGQEVWSESLEWVGDARFLCQDGYIPLVMSPQPCVYRASALEALDNHHIPWRIALSSTSYSVTIEAVKAGMGIAVLPSTMIPKDISIIRNSRLPKLKNTNVSLLKHSHNNSVVSSFEQFILRKFRR